MKPKFEINMNGSYKLGMNEVVGLKDALTKALQPVVKHIQDNVYWSSIKLTEAEYKSRDGFIAYKDNGGGLIIDLIIPKCEEYDFGYLEFGECDGCNDDCSKCTREVDETGECMNESEGHLDARLRIWLKFEGINENDELEFYLTADGGNGDAPYFRLNHLNEIFNAEFKTKSVAGIQRAASKHIKALIQALS